MAPSTELTMEELSDYFHLPEKQVAAKMGMCLTSLKKICRSHGITRWPFRKLKSLERTMKKMNEDSQQIGAMTTAPSASLVIASPSPSPVQPAHKHSNHGETSTISKSNRLSNFEFQPAQNHSNYGEASAISTKSNRLSDFEADDSWPCCTVSGADMRQLVVKNWSTFWTVQNMRNHLLTALGGFALRFSEDGCRAYLEFGSSLAAVQARTVCEQACDMLRDRMEASAPVMEAVTVTTILAQQEAPAQEESLDSWRASAGDAQAPQEAMAPQSVNTLQYVHGDLIAQIGGDAPHSTMRPDTRSSWPNQHAVWAPPSTVTHALAPPSSMVQAPASGGVVDPSSSCSSHSVHSGSWSPHWVPTFVSC